LSFRPASVTSEGGHWYDRSGVQVSTVIGSKGQSVKPDLRHARKFGFAPGVTTILKAAHKEQLVQYRERQVLLASLTLPQIAGESHDEWVKRIMVDAKTHAIEAAARGSEIHAQIENELKLESSQNPWVLAVRDALSVFGVSLGAWRCEMPCVSDYGYGTKSDLSCDATEVDMSSEAKDFAALNALAAGDVRRLQVVLDFKTKDGDLSDVALYPEHHQQLAATAQALGLPNAQCGIVFVSRTEPKARLLMADDEDIQHGWQVFKALLNYWQTVNKYRPEWATNIYD